MQQHRYQLFPIEQKKFVSVLQGAQLRTCRWPQGYRAFSMMTPLLKHDKLTETKGNSMVNVAVNQLHFSSVVSRMNFSRKTTIIPIFDDRPLENLLNEYTRSSTEYSNG